MSSIESIAREFIEEGYNEKNFEKSIFERFSKELISSDINGKLSGVCAFRSLFVSWGNAFPNAKITIKQMTSYKNTVVASIVSSGTHENKFTLPTSMQNSFVWRSNFSHELTKLPPKGKKFSAANDIIFIFSNKKIERMMLTDSNMDAGWQLEMAAFFKDVKIEESKRLLIDMLQQMGQPPFTKKEIGCLALSFSGLSAKQIGLITKNSHRTVEQHLYNATRKAGCFSKYQLIEKMLVSKVLHLWHRWAQFVLQPLECRTIFKM